MAQLKLERNTAYRAFRQIQSLDRVGLVFVAHTIVGQDAVLCETWYCENQLGQTQYLMDNNQLSMVFQLHIVNTDKFFDFRFQIAEESPSDDQLRSYLTLSPVGFTLYHVAKDGVRHILTIALM